MVWNFWKPPALLTFSFPTSLASASLQPEQNATKNVGPKLKQTLLESKGHKWKLEFR